MRVDLERHAVLGGDQLVVGPGADDVLLDGLGAAARPQLDDRAAQLGEPDDRLGERAAERAQAGAVDVDHRGRAHHVAREPGQAIAGAVDQPVGVVGARQAQRLAPAQRALDPPGEQRTVDPGEAVGRGRQQAQPRVVRIDDGQAELVAIKKSESVASCGASVADVASSVAAYVVTLRIEQASGVSAFAIVNAYAHDPSVSGA